MLLQVEKLACLIIFLFVCTEVVHSDLVPSELFPNMVYLENQKGELICAGTIFNMQNILTAATCVYEKRPEELRMFLINGENVEIKSIKIHEEFKQLPDGKVSNNIAILKTDFLPATRHHKQYFLPLAKNFRVVNPISEGRFANTVIWVKKPKLSDDQPSSYGLPKPRKTLRKTLVLMYNNETCSSQYKNWYDDRTKSFCVVQFEHPELDKFDREKENCETHIGGPVVLNSRQIGIIVKSCHFIFAYKKYKYSKIEGTFKFFPKIAIAISPYLDWIDKNSVYIYKTAKPKASKTMSTSSDLQGRNKMKEKSKKNKKNNASSFRAFFLFKTVAFCVTASLFNL